MTKDLPGDRWLEILKQAGCRVEVSKHHDTILSNATIKKLIGSKCDGVIGQLTEVGAAERPCMMHGQLGTAPSRGVLGPPPGNWPRKSWGSKEGISPWREVCVWAAGLGH